MIGLTELQKAVNEAKEAGKLIIGTNSVKVGMKNGNLSTIVYASNCPDGLKREITSYSRLSKIEVSSFSGDSAKLGEMCGKPFSILVVGIKK